MSDVKLSLVSFDGFGELGASLVNRIGDFVSEGLAPWQIRRRARAEADVAYTMAVSDVSVEAVYRRAKSRVEQETARHQLNMERIVWKAVPELREGDKPETLEDDWLEFFFSRARLVSDDRVQSVWAKMLAGEARAKGSFSRRAIDTVALLDSDDAQRFTRLCTCLWQARTIELLILDAADPVYEELGITLADLLHLDGIGLVSVSGFLEFKSKPMPDPVGIKYDGVFYLLTHKEPPHQFPKGRAILTAVGKQLSQIAGGIPNAKYLAHCIAKFEADGYTVERRSGGAPMMENDE